MPPPVRVYVPGQDTAIDKLVQTYDALDGSTLAVRDEAEERTIEDPLGFKTESRPNGREAAKRMVEKLLKLSSLLLVENRVTDPADQLFAYELFSLNVLNSVDCPLSAREVDAVRREAFEYYDKATRTT
jgi:hypothetical protein